MCRGSYFQLEKISYINPRTCLSTLKRGDELLIFKFILNIAYSNLNVKSNSISFKNQLALKFPIGSEVLPGRNTLI